MTKTYYSVTRFTDAILKNDSKVDTIILPFVPERQKADRYGQYFIEPIGIIMKYNNSNKPTILSYETMIKTYGLPIIKFAESKYRKINFRSDMQALKIKTEEKEFDPDKDNEFAAANPNYSPIIYYPSSIAESDILSKPVLKKIVELKDEYLSKNDFVGEFDDDANFI